MDAAGDFVVVWNDTGNHDGSSLGIFGQRFASSGARLGVEFQVNSYTPDPQRTPSIGMEANGDFVVAWDSYRGIDPALEIRAQRFDSAGARIGGELVVNTYTPNAQYGAQVAVDADGDFVVAWASFAQLDATTDIFGQRFSSSGSRLGGEFRVNSGAPGDQYFLFPPERAIAIDASGDFVVAWNSYEQDGSLDGVFAQRFDSNGAKVAVELQVNVHADDEQSGPAVALAAQGGEFVVAWQSRYQDSDTGYGVFARRFSFGAAVKTLDIDGNDTITALTDGLLVLRRMFGFTGSALTTGAVGNGCTRCDAAAIESYLAGILALLDVDDNGSGGALTDGVLVLRRMFGFSGTALTNGALGSGCMRCDPADIAAYIDGLS
jgi:hypothetical protein